MAPQSWSNEPQKRLKPSAKPKVSILGGEKDDSLEENGTFCGKTTPKKKKKFFREHSEAKLAGVLGKYKLPITKLKRAGRGILYLKIKK